MKWCSACEKLILGVRVQVMKVVFRSGLAISGPIRVPSRHHTQTIEHHGRLPLAGGYLL